MGKHIAFIPVEGRFRVHSCDGGTLSVPIQKVNSKLSAAELIWEKIMDWEKIIRVLCAAFSPVSNQLSESTVPEVLLEVTQSLPQGRKEKLKARGRQR